MGVGDAGKFTGFSRIYGFPEGGGAARGHLGHGSALPGFLGPHGYVLVSDKETRTERRSCLG